MADGDSRPLTRQRKAHTLEKEVATSLVETIPVVGDHVTDQAASPGVYEEAAGDVSVSGPLPISVQGPASTHSDIVSNTRHPAGSREVQQLRQRLTALETSMFLHSGPRVVPSSGSLPRSSVTLPAISVGMEPSGYPYAVTSVGESEPLGFPQAVPSTGSSTAGATRAGWSAFEAGPDPWGPHRMEFGMTRGDPRRSHSLGDAARGEPRMRLPEYDGKGDWKGFHMQFWLLSSQYQWPTGEQGKRLIACLRGDALQYAARLPQSVLSDVSTLLQALHQRFGDPMLPETYRASLLNLKKGPKETLREYEARVHQLMIKAYPGLEGAEFFETLAIEHLCNGLPDPNMAFDILVKKPRTIQQALDMIEWYECCRQTSRRRGPVLRQVSPSVPGNDRETAGGAVRHIGPNRQWVTEERLQQFGQELQDGLTKSLSKTMAEQLQAAVAKWPRADPVHPQTGTRAEVKPVKRTLRTTRPCDPGSSGPRRPGQDQAGSWGACFKCGGSGHFARECSNRAQVREVTVDSDFEATWEIGEPVPVEGDADQDTEVQENCRGSDLTA